MAHFCLIVLALESSPSYYYGLTNTTRGSPPIFVNAYVCVDVLLLKTVENPAAPNNGLFY